MVRTSQQDALTDDEFRRLVQAVPDIPAKYHATAYWVLFGAGRLGLRAGELAHASEHWINWDRELLEIPYHEPCDCGYCLKQARQELTYDETKSLEERFKKRWQPKTEQSARAIPFGFDLEVAAVVKSFFSEYDQYPRSRITINRRLDRVASAAGMDPDTIYPHALRATAATYHAYRGVPAVALQSFMGWGDIQTAQHYLRLSGTATKDAVVDAHSDGIQ